MAYSGYTIPTDTYNNNYSSVSTQIYLYADTTSYTSYTTALATTSTYYPYKDLYDGYAIRVVAAHTIVDALNEWGGFCLEPTYGQSYGFSCAIQGSLVSSTGAIDARYSYFLPASVSSEVEGGTLDLLA